MERDRSKSEFELFSDKKKEEHLQYLIGMTMEDEHVSDIISFEDPETHKWYAKVLGGCPGSGPRDEIMVETALGYDTENEAKYTAIMLFHGKMTEDAPSRSGGITR